MKIYVFGTVLFPILFSLQSAAQPLKPDTMAFEFALACDQPVKKQYRGVRQPGPVTVKSAALKNADKKILGGVHKSGGGAVRAKGVARAYQWSLELQRNYLINGVNYFPGQKKGTLFCMAQSPGAGSLIYKRRKADGLPILKTEPVKEGHLTCSCIQQ